MRIRDLPTWPPQVFQCSDVKGVYVSRVASKLIIQRATLAPSGGARTAPDPEVFLVLTDPETEQTCTTRVKVKDPSNAVRAVQALARCKGRSLAEVGDLELHPKEAD